MAVRHRHLGTQMPSGGVHPITQIGRCRSQEFWKIPLPQADQRVTFAVRYSRNTPANPSGPARRVPAMPFSRSLTGPTHRPVTAPCCSARIPTLLAGRPTRGRRSSRWLSSGGVSRRPSPRSADPGSGRSSACDTGLRWCLSEPLPPRHSVRGSERHHRNLGGLTREARPGSSAGPSRRTPRAPTRRSCSARASTPAQCSPPRRCPAL